MTDARGWPLERLLPDQFTRLALALLKREISPAVRLVSRAGPDGGRDAWLEGSCVSGRYDWDGVWIFQFKHYSSPGAQSQVLRDFRAGLMQVKALHPELANYVLLTTVPFTGNPGRGSFDRFATLRPALATETGVENLDLWDANELDVLCSLHRAVAEEFFGPGARKAGAVAVPYLDLDPLLERDDETLAWTLESALGRGTWVLAPGSDSTLWQALMSAEYAALHRTLRRLLRRLDRANPAWLESEQGRRVNGWFSLLAAATAAKLGRAHESLRLTRRVRRLEPERIDPELHAWWWNVYAMAAGKLDRDLQHARAVELGVAVSRASGNEWLARTIELRAIHKRDWAAAERGRSGADSIEEQIVSVAASPSSDLGAAALEHLLAQQDAYVALHYTWDENSWARADRAIRSAHSRFEQLGDQAELARLISESGRLALVADRAPEQAADELRRGLALRVRAGELPRVRYDLVYLADAMRRQGLSIEAELCLWSAAAIQRELYGTSADPGIVAQIVAGLRSSENELATRAGRQRLEPGLLAEVLTAATGLDELGLAGMVEIGALPGLIAVGDVGLALNKRGRERPVR